MLMKRNIVHAPEGDGQNGGAGGGSGGTTPTPPVVTTPKPDESAAKALQAAEARAAAAEAKLAQQEADAKKAADAKLVAEQGAQALVDKLSPAAAKWEAHEKAETARITKARETLPPKWQAALDAATTLDGKAAILALHASETTTPAPKPPEGGGGPPGGGANGTAVDVAKMLETKTIEQVRRTNPAELDAYLDAQVAAHEAAKPRTLFSTLMKPKATAKA